MFFHSSVQVLYLDSLAVPNVQIPGGLPRVAAWKKPLIDKVIKLDTNIDGTFGKLKVCLPFLCKSILTIA